MLGIAVDIWRGIYGGAASTPVPSGGFELREDGTFELREDGTFELRE